MAFIFYPSSSCKIPNGFYNTVVSIVRAASQQAQLVHNAQVQAVQTEKVSADELWSFVSKNKSNASQMS